MRFDPHCTINSLSLNCLACDYSQYTYTLKYNNGNKLKLKKKKKWRRSVGFRKKCPKNLNPYKKVFKEVNRRFFLKISMLSNFANNFI